MRLARALAQAGVASRRGAETLIRAGRVRVDGVVVREVVRNVEAGRSRIEVDGRSVEAERKTYLILNKPAGVVSTVRDPHARRTVLNYVPDSWGRLFPVGRLDKETTGLILLTNDGELANRLLHPRYGAERCYRARVQGRPTPKALRRLTEGLAFGAKRARAERVRVIKERRETTELEIVLKEGWKHEVKVLLATVGYPVLQLERIRFAGLSLAGLKRGDIRRLKPREIRSLQRQGDETT